VYEGEGEGGINRPTGDASNDNEKIKSSNLTELSNCNLFQNEILTELTGDNTSEEIRGSQ
jgi:hypothetical protein